MSPLNDVLEKFLQEHGLGEKEKELLSQFAKTLNASPDPLDSNPDAQPTFMVDIGGEDLLSFLEPDEGDGPEMDLGSGHLSQHSAAIPSLPTASGKPTPATPGSLDLKGGYEDQGRIGVGGMAEIRRVFDAKLGRSMAIKLLHKNLLEKDLLVARFIEEAQVTAQLQHPGIVPVHDLGRLPDGKYYFTMKEVEGKTLRQIIRALHKAVKDDAWQPIEGGWTFRRLIQAFKQVCDAVAYAHSRGVVHRDLKPANIMVGDFGEVLVLDWGIAKVLGSKEEKSFGTDPDMEAVVTQRTMDQTFATLYGTVPGTPSYMPPEQAMGKAVDVRADVYALGSILYEILSGRPPYGGKNPLAIMAALCQNPPPPVGRPIKSTESKPSAHHLKRGPVRAIQGIEEALCPAALRELTEWAMARHKDDRPADAGIVAAEVDAFLQGAKRLDEARQITQEAKAIEPLFRQLRFDAGKLRKKAEEAAKSIKPYEPTKNKEQLWAMEDKAETLERQADLKEVIYLQKLRAALVQVPDLPEALNGLAQYYLDRHIDAEKNRQKGPAAQFEVLLKAHDRSGKHAAYLKGDGAFSLATNPTGATVEIRKFVTKGRRLVLGQPRQLGTTPITRMAIPKGSYMVRLRAPGRLDVNYPISIGRGEHWHGIRPGDSKPFPIYLPLPKEISADDCYVPAGWFASGGDPAAPKSLEHNRIWVDSFVMRRYPVTNREYIVFLDDLVSRGHEKTALKWAPRDRGGSTDEEGPLLFARDKKGQFFLQKDADGDEWFPMAPVVMVNWASAKACAAWCRGRTQQGWRLPFEMEWAKAARGVDGRFFPWGDFIDPTWTCIRDSHEDRPGPKLVTDFPLDASVYGVKGMAGNINEWCLDVFEAEGPALKSGLFVPEEVQGNDDTMRVNKGGSWYSPTRDARVCDRKGYQAALRYANLGLRLVRSFP